MTECGEIATAQECFAMTKKGRICVIASDQRERGNPEGCEDEVRGNLSEMGLLRRCRSSQ